MKRKTRVTTQLVIARNRSRERSVADGDEAPPRAPPRVLAVVLAVAISTVAYLLKAGDCFAEFTLKY